MILVTGGAGYIGSHACVVLLNAGYEVLVVDNFCNSSPKSLYQVEKITNRTLNLVEGDIRDKETLTRIFSEYKIEAVIHFAAFKAVGESVSNPIGYYDNNVCGSTALLSVMNEFDCKRFIFSSSATVYGEPSFVPINEGAELSTTSPYGATKLTIENMLKDIVASDSSWQVVILRYFNPVGAHKSGLIGENPKGIPNNLMPFILDVVCGKKSKLKIFGGDYPTRDGTGIRDYIHVVDLAEGHLSALRFLMDCGFSEPKDSPLIVNLGTGKGYSVLDVVKTVEKISNKKLPYEITARRKGDIAECFAETSYAKEILGWKAQCDIHDMCKDSLRWRHLNPDGYK
nr:UDP-glucose 4-epimerase GalE [Marinobacter sp.]